jgi:hypothetical protein
MSSIRHASLHYGVSEGFAIWKISPATSSSKSLGPSKGVRKNSSNVASTQVAMTATRRRTADSGIPNPPNLLIPLIAMAG